MNNSKIWVAVVVVAIIAIGGYLFPKVQIHTNIQNAVDKAVEKAVNSFGALTSPTLFDHIEFKESFTKGGNAVATTTVDATIVLGTGHRFDRTVSSLEMNIGVNATVTTMASTTAPLSNLAVGESLEVLFYNASTTAGSTATFAAGTGVDLQEDEGETVIVNGLEVARLTFLKKQDTDVILWVEVGQVGD